MAPRITVINTLAIIVILSHLYGVDAVGEEYADIARHFKASISSRNATSESHKAETDQMETLAFIENHLRSVIDTDEIEPNIAEIKRLYHLGDQYYTAEERRRSEAENKLLRTADLERPDHEVVLFDNLNRLEDLDQIIKDDYPCDYHTTYLLSRLNSLAMDPVGRRLRYQPDLWPRIDNMVFRVAVNRARKCIMGSKGNLDQLARSQDHELMQMYWKQILERRMERTNLEGVSLEKASTVVPEEVNRFIDSMPHAAFDQNEMDIVLDMFNKFLTRSCQRYISQALNIFATYDFDAQLKGSISGAALSREDDKFLKTNVHRTYMKICEKFILERTPSYLALLKQGVDLYPMDHDLD